MAEETMKPEDADKTAGAAQRAEAAVKEDTADPAVELARENGELKDRVLRTMAEMENLRRRTEREVRDASQYAIASFARDMLTVGDNLQRALSAIPAEARAAAEPTLMALLEGVEMTEREMLNTLSKHGVKRLEPKGEKFDPNFHQAMFEVPDPSVAAGTVTQVVQTGYVIGERVLRPAMVGIARGGPKTVPAGDVPQGGGEPGSTVDRSA